MWISVCALCVPSPFGRRWSQVDGPYDRWCVWHAEQNHQPRVLWINMSSSGCVGLRIDFDFLSMCFLNTQHIASDIRCHRQTCTEFHRHRFFTKPTTAPPHSNASTRMSAELLNRLPEPSKRMFWAKLDFRCEAKPEMRRRVPVSHILTLLECGCWECWIGIACWENLQRTQII